MNYRTAICASVGRIERAFSREDLDSISRHDLAELVIKIYDILSEAVAPDWWERDIDAENEMKERVLDSFKTN